MPLHNTMVSPNTRLLQRGYDQVKRDMARTRRASEPALHTLADLTLASTATATLHLTQHVPPTLKVEHRKQSNETIHDYNRVGRSTAAALRSLERAASLDTIALSRHRKSVVGYVERAARLLWLGGKSHELLGVRPTPSPTQVKSAISSSKREAAALKATLETHLAAVDAVLRALQAARGQLDGVIKAVERPLQLAPLTYSSVPSHVLPDAPEVQELQRLQREAAQLRGVGAALMRETDAAIAAAQSKAEEALQQSAGDAKALQTELSAAQGRALIATHVARRSAHELDIQKGVDAGPQEGRFTFTRARLERPLVSHYNTSAELTFDITARERSPRGQHTLTRSLSVASVDAGQLARLHSTLGEAVLDVERDRQVDEQVVRMRRRCDPGRRV